MEKLPRVLLADDDPSGRAMLVLSLRQAGFDVDSAGGGEEALALLEEGNYQFLVTDAQMGAMDGFELALRAVEFDPALRIVMISASRSEADIRGYPIETIFSKPVAIDGLVQWLRAPAPSRSRGYLAGTQPVAG
ncbi:MAG TPA: response regulator [Elusimicrobiota bacterium]|jgi:CheY-like chemotaxis protein|nr:response regulator [Elusimicrobiota bacterium]